MRGWRKLIRRGFCAGLLGAAVWLAAPAYIAAQSQYCTTLNPVGAYTCYIPYGTYSSGFSFSAPATLTQSGNGGAGGFANAATVTLTLGGDVSVVQTNTPPSSSSFTAGSSFNGAGVLAAAQGGNGGSGGGGNNFRGGNGADVGGTKISVTDANVTTTGNSGDEYLPGLFAHPGPRARFLAAQIAIPQRISGVRTVRFGLQDVPSSVNARDHRFEHA